MYHIVDVELTANRRDVEGRDELTSTAEETLIVCFCLLLTQKRETFDFFWDLNNYSLLKWAKGLIITCVKSFSIRQAEII